MQTAKKSCADLVESALHGRMVDIIALWDDYKRGVSEDNIKDFLNYGLSFDYVAPGTFTGQTEGYWRWQISWGGPSDEFRFYSSGPDYPCYRIEYWYLDWYDGAMILPGPSYWETLEEIWQWFGDVGSAEAEYLRAKE